MTKIGTAAAQRKAFTPRSTEIVGWIALGKTDWQTGEILSISAKTVNYHIERLKQKLCVSTRSQVVLAAVLCGVLAADHPAPPAIPAISPEGAVQMWRPDLRPDGD